MVEVSNNFIQECEANVGTYKFGKIKVNYIDDNPFNYEQGAYSSSNGAKIDAEQSIRYNKLVECEPNFKYKIELGNSAYKMKIVTYNANQAFIAAHDNLAEGSELTTESTAAYISVTIYSNDTLEGTNITLNNTIRNSEISGAELKGNTTQDGTPTPSSPVPVNNVTGEQVVRVCGKNLLDYSAFEKGRINSSTGKIEHADKVTNFSTTENTISFTATQAWNNGVASGFIPFRSGTYIIKGTVTGQRSPVYVDYYNADKSWLSRYSNTNMPFEPGVTTSYVLNLNNSNASYIRIHFEASTAGDVTITNLQLEKGSTATTFEEYQGKDYEINLGKNLFDKDKATTGGRLSNVNGTIYAESGYFYSNFIKVEPSTSYTKNSAIADAYHRVCFYSSASESDYISKSESNVFTTPNDCEYIRFCGIDTEINTTQLEKGTTPTTYAPYFTPIELNKIGDYQDYIRKGTGKNLFIPTLKVDDTNINTIRCSVSLNGDEYTFSATGSDCYFGNIVGTGNAYNKLFGTLYDVSGITNLVFKPTNSAFDKNYVCYYDNNKVSLGYGQINNNTGRITPIANTKYIGFRIGISNSVSGTNYTTKIQLEKGSSATSFEPYGYKDKWYIEKKIGKYVFDGSSDEQWRLNSSGTYYKYQWSAALPDKYNVINTPLYCNYFPQITVAQGNARNVIGIANGAYAGYSIQIVCAEDSLNAFITWLSTHNTIVYYVLANTTYTLIENEELIEQLDAVSHAETQEGTTNITSSGILPAILDVTPNLIESIRGKQTIPIVGYNITGDDDLINFKITSKADSNGNILGATSQSQVDIEIFNENNTHNLENKQVYISTGLNETEGNYCKWQPFTITQTKDTQTKNHTTYTGYDDMMRGNEAYIDNVDYGEEGVTLYDFTCKLAKEMGMALGNITMTNGDFIVKGNNFTNNEAKLVVLKNVAQMAGGFAMIDRDNLLRIVELSPEEAMTPIELTTNLYTEDFQNSAKFGEINEFAIGETNIETNAIVRSDDASIAKNGVKKIEILDNMFLGLLEDKEIAIEPLWDAFNGFSYYPFKTPYNGYPYIDLGDKINITDINSNVYSTLVLNNVFEYNGGYKGNIGAEALSITAAKYKTNNTLSKQFRKVGIDIDRVEGKITSEIATATDGITQAYNTAINQTAENIGLSVTAINNTISGNPEVEGDTGLAGLVQTINSSYLTVDSDGFKAVSSTATAAQEKADKVEENTQKIVSQLQFDAVTGLTISAEGSTDDDMKLNLTNSQVNFMYRNSPVLVINGNKIEFTGATFQKFDLGNYVWQAEDDDSLSLIYEGD